MTYCEGHPGYGEDKLGNCRFCGKPRSPYRETSRFSGYVDPFVLAKGLQARQEQNKREWIPLVSNCPYCQIKALSYNTVRDEFECLNIKCKKYHVQIHYTSVEYSFIITYIQTYQ